MKTTGEWSMNTPELKILQAAMECRHPDEPPRPAHGSPFVRVECNRWSFCSGPRKHNGIVNYGYQL